MATEKQIQANRRNSLRSTGPCTPEGKARSAQNALKTGLYAQGIVIGHENPSNLAELERQFTAEYAPATPTERSLVDSLIHLEWMLRRYRWLETEIWKASQDALTTDQLSSAWTGHAFITQPAIARIHRLRASAQKAFRDTLADLQTLQAARPQPVETEATSEEIGFVPSPGGDREAEPSGTTPAPGPLSVPYPDRPPAPFSAPETPPPDLTA